MKKTLSIYLNLTVVLFVLTSLLSFPSTALAALSVSNVTPDSITNNHASTITVSGNDFIDGAIVSLDGYGALTTLFASATSLSATVPADVPVGTYTVTVTNPDSSVTSLANALRVLPDAPTAASTQTQTPTATSEPPRSYERPVVVVDGYSLDQDSISPGDAFTLFVTLYNAGQQYATNVVANFTSGDLVPRDTGGVVSVGEIAPGNHKEFGQPLYLSSGFWGTVTSITMTISYTNETGMPHTETFTISLPVHLSYGSYSTATSTPTQSPTPAIKPQLVITSYTTNVTPLQPGTQFSLSLVVENMGNSTATNVTMVVGGGSISSGDSGTPQPGGISGSTGEFTNFAPIGASNVQSLGDFLPGSTSSASQPLIVNVSINPGAYPLKISFVYINDHNQTFVDDQVITLLVYRLPILEVSFYQPVSTLLVGQPNTLPLQVVNLGRNSIVLGNMRVDASGGQFSNNTILVGNLDPGGYFTLDATYIPDTPGPTNLLVSVNYTDDFNKPQVITQTLPVEVMDQPVIEPPTDGGQTNGLDVVPPAPETFLQKVWRFLLGLVGLDSGAATSQPPVNEQPIETSSPVQPIKGGMPPLKGP